MEVSAHTYMYIVYHVRKSVSAFYYYYFALIDLSPSLANTSWSSTLEPTLMAHLNYLIYSSVCLITYTFEDVKAATSDEVSVAEFSECHRYIRRTL